MSDGDISPKLSGRFLEPGNLKSRVSRLQVMLETDNFTLDTECLLQTLEQCFLTCAAELLDEQIFRKILPKAHRSLSQVVKAIDERISDNEKIGNLDDVKRKLHFCDGLLVFWRKCVEHVSALKKIRALHVASLCSILPETIKIIFEHCKTSPKTYGALLSSAMQELKNLFSRASAIFKLFFATLDGVIVFDTDVESETELLTKVVDAYGNIASIAYGMDTKTHIEISEAFAKLAVDNQNDIKCASPSSVATHLAQMAKDASCLLSTIKDQNDKNMERTTVATMRLLKIVEKLTAVYGTFFACETLLYLIELSTRMHGYSYLNLTKGGGRIISVNTASFLDIIFDHDDFKQAYFEYGRKTDVCRLNYHLLTITVMKKLNSIPYERHCKWYLGMNSILDVAFTHIEHLQGEIIVGELRLPGNHEIGERPRLAGIYEATLVPICDLVSQIPSEAFHALELLLLKHLLSGRFWSSLLSSDVWCFIGRLSTSQLCADHIKYLIRVAAALTERRNTVEVVMLDIMIGRLYELLSEDAKSALLDDLADLDASTFDTPTLHWLAAKVKGSHPKHLIYKIDDLSKAFSDLREHPTTRNWKHLMQRLSTMQAVDYSDNRDINDVMAKMWSFVADAIIECESRQLDLLSDFVVTLLDGTHLDNLRDNVLDSVLMSIAVACTCMPSRVKIKLCQYLRRSVENLDRCEDSDVSTLTKLFSRLLEDENPWVLQETLESFERIGHTCSKRLVVKLAKGLAKIPTISNIMQAYLSCTPHYVLEGFLNACDYLGHISEATQGHCEHMCYEHGESEREEKIPRLEENSQNIAPVLIQLDEQAEQMYKRLTEALEGRANVSETVCRKLITVLEKILNTSN
ncbi:uncharacterized protein C1orf112 [Harpegnathos saltator]|uniref:uncharacterized protein C1orf112 n=1 Tax=Harpegnathos saltator TaxID=610380 RepID=UPI000591440C|nr:uncharacterized protein C1orf112 [Harpegnathos saltator]